MILRIITHYKGKDTWLVSNYYAMSIESEEGRTIYKTNSIFMEGEIEGFIAGMKHSREEKIKLVRLSKSDDNDFYGKDKK